VGKEEKLVNKLKHLLRRLGTPRWLHHFGPKKYEFLHHLFALIVRFYCKLSYRRIKKLLDMLGITCPSKSALQYTAAKLNSGFWQKALKATSGDPYLVAIDSTGFSRTNPSYHYIKRIDGKMPKTPVKLSVAFDTRKKKFCTAKIRVIPAHDIKDAPNLLMKCIPKKVVADKGYNAESLYEFAADNNFLLMTPQKKNVRRGFYRKKMLKLFRKKTYNRRQLVEAGFSSIKRKFGASVSSKTVRTIRTDIYGRMLCHNLLFFSWSDF